MKLNIYYRALIFSIILYFPSIADTSSLKEKDIKALFLFNFTQFITWPDTAFNSIDALFNICILGNNPFKGSLDKLVQNEMVEQHPIKVREIDKIERIQQCHIVYVSGSKKRDLEDIFAVVRGKPILTVSDIKKFVPKGGMVGFFKQKRKIRFYIAPQSMRAVQLIPNSNLLRVAKIVER